MTAPAVSAIIPVFNGERFIADAIRSVLGQTFADLECIVVDDGSTDGTKDVVASIDDARIRYAHQPNQGVASARNLGIATAAGRLVAFLDADDVWLPQKVAWQVDQFESRPDLGLLLTAYEIVDVELHPLRTVFPVWGQVDPRRLLLLEVGGIGLSFTGMARRDLAHELGFDESYSTSADLEFALRVASVAAIDVIPEPLALYRSHRDQMHLDRAAFERDVRRLFDVWLSGPEVSRPDRRRALGNLYARLFLYEAYRRQWPTATRALARGLRWPDRLVALPVTMVAARLRNRWSMARMKSFGPRDERRRPP